MIIKIMQIVGERINCISHNTNFSRMDDWMWMEMWESKIVKIENGKYFY